MLNTPCRAGIQSVEDTGFGYTLSLIGGKYKMVVMFWLNRNTTLRFNEMKRRIGSISYKTLASTLKEMERDGLVARAEALGKRLRQGFEQALAGVAGFTGMQGKGLMIGIGLDRPCSALVKMALDEGLVINVTAERVVRLLPPLILSDAEADELVQRLAPLIRRFLQEGQAAR